MSSLPLLMGGQTKLLGPQLNLSLNWLLKQICDENQKLMSDRFVQWLLVWLWASTLGHSALTCCPSLCPCAWHLLISFYLLNVFLFLPETSAAEGHDFCHPWIQCLETWLTQRNPSRCLSDQLTMHTDLGKAPEGKWVFNSTGMTGITVLPRPWLPVGVAPLLSANAPVRLQSPPASKACLYHFLFYHLAHCLH